MVMAFDNGFPGARGAPHWFYSVFFCKKSCEWILRFKILGQTPACAWLVCPGILPVLLCTKFSHVCGPSSLNSCQISLPRRYSSFAYVIFYFRFCAGEIVTSFAKSSKTLFSMKCLDIVNFLTLDFHSQVAPPPLSILFINRARRVSPSFVQNWLYILWLYILAIHIAYTSYGPGQKGFYSV